MFYKLEPEVSGEMGGNTELDVSTHPPKVSKLHYHLDFWLGDDLLETFPCFLVTDKLRAVIEEMKATGAAFGEVEVSFGEEFRERYPGGPLPRLSWLKPIGVPCRDDFGLVDTASLVVSERLWDAMRARANLSHCEAEPYTG